MPMMEGWLCTQARGTAQSALTDLSYDLIIDCCVVCMWLAASAAGTPRARKQEATA